MVNINAKDFLYERGLITRSTDDAKDWRVNASADNIIQAMEDYAAFITGKPFVKGSLPICNNCNVEMKFIEYYECKCGANRYSK
jgi:hypothetical protein